MRFIFLISFFVFSHAYDLNTSIFRPIKNPSFGSFDPINSTNIFLANILESGKEGDNTENFIDLNSKSINIKNINLLYSNEYSSLLFQREFFVNENYLNYYNGLVNRFHYKDLTLGFNAFTNRHERQGLYNFGGEFLYGNYFKFFTNYYTFDNEFLEDDLEVGLNFTLPFYSYINIDLIKDNTKFTQSLNFNPYSLFNISLNRQMSLNTLEPREESFSIFLNFNFFYTQSIRKHFKKNSLEFKRYNNYNFFKNRYLR